MAQKDVALSSDIHAKLVWKAGPVSVGLGLF